VSVSSVKQAEIAADKKASSQEAAPAPSKKKVSWWLILLVSSLVLGSLISRRLSGASGLSSQPPQQILIAVFGGLLVGIGAAFAGGCVIGNIMSGWALMSIGTVLFAVVVVLSNWVTTYFYLMGGTFRK
jgi:hypothetical protein